MMLTLSVAFHVVAAVIWVGGMFFALIVLRPSTGPLDPPVRLALWQRVFSRFFPWVWAAVVVLLVSGFAMVIWGFGGFSQNRDLRAHHDGSRDPDDADLRTPLFRAVATLPPRGRRREWPTAATHIDQIRLLVTINLILGLITVVVGAAGRYYG